MYLDDKANPTILLNFGSLIPTLIFCNQDIALWQNSATSDSLGAEPDHLTMPVLEQISSDHRSPSRVYKRSSNNSHKKFLSVAQKLLFAELEHS